MTSTPTNATASSSPPCILVTGGCGYIGTHTITCLLNSLQKYSVVVIDNLVNASSKSLDRVAAICNLSEEERSTRLKLYTVDICDEEGMKKVFQESPQFESCIHFAGLKVCLTVQPLIVCDLFLIIIYIYSISLFVKIVSSILHCCYYL